MVLLTKHKLPGQEFLSCPFHIFLTFNPFSIRLKPSEDLALLFEDTHLEEKAIFQWFVAFCEGRHLPFPIKLNFEGLGPFTRDVLLQLQKIPFGETKSYGQIAEILGNRNASRAVGNACRVNPFPLVIPCHRVVQQNGLGGFAYGAKMKESLLLFEKHLIQST